jgi:ribosomal protein S4
MRKIPKYKIFNKTKIFLINSFKKINKFKRSKWIIYKKTVKKYSKRKNFINFFLSSLKLKIWEKKKKFFKNELQIKRIISQCSDSSVRFKTVKKYFLKKINKTDYYNLNILKKSFIRLEFRIDILLHRLNFFPSIMESRVFLRNFGILINNKFIKNSNYCVNKGDIISFHVLKYDVKKNLKSQIKISSLYPFVEIDYYTNTIIVIKNLNELGLEDIALFYPKYTDLSNICHLFSK